jgi:sec-independent protein translocase protein TatA
MGSLGAPELLIILAIVVLLFGSTRLPKMARSLGQASKEFRKGVADGHAGDDDPEPAADEDPAPVPVEAKAETSEDDGTDPDAKSNGSRTKSAGDTAE